MPAPLGLDDPDAAGRREILRADVRGNGDLNRRHQPREQPREHARQSSDRYQPHAILPTQRNLARRTRSFLIEVKCRPNLDIIDALHAASKRRDGPLEPPAHLGGDLAHFGTADELHHRLGIHDLHEDLARVVLAHDDVTRQ